MRMPPSRRSLIGGAAAVAGTIAMPAIGRAAPPTIRYSTAGGLGPNEIETIIFTAHDLDAGLAARGRVRRIRTPLGDRTRPVPLDVDEGPALRDQPRGLSRRVAGVPFRLELTALDVDP